MKYFLTILEAADVTKERKTDDALQLLHFSSSAINCVWHPISASPALSQTPHTPSVAFLPFDNSCQDVLKSIEIHHKTHSHLVFKEVCMPLFKLRNLEEIFKTLKNAFHDFLLKPF